MDPRENGDRGSTQLIFIPKVLGANHDRDGASENGNQANNKIAWGNNTDSEEDSIQPLVKPVYKNPPLDEGKGKEDVDDDDDGSTYIDHVPVVVAPGRRSPTTRNNRIMEELKEKFFSGIDHIKLHRDHDPGLDLSEDGEDDEMNTLKVSRAELFFDLIFVAAAIELGEFLKFNLNLEGIIDIFLMFTTLWLTWFHTNMLLTRFKVPNPLTFGIFIIMIGTVGIAVHAVEKQGDTCASTVVNGVEFHNRAIYLSILATRLTFICFYADILWGIPKARPMCTRYLIVFILSSILALVASIVNDLSVSRVVWPIGLLLEIFMYLWSLVIRRDYNLPLNIEHTIERNELWVILILGESVIGIVTSDVSNDTYGSSFYFSAGLAFLCVYWVMTTYSNSQPDFESGMDTHALDFSPTRAFLYNFLHLFITIGALGLGVAFKLLLPHSQDNKYFRKYAWLLTGSLSFALISINLARGTHEWAYHEVLGFSYGRQFFWGLHTVISIVILPLALAINAGQNSDGEYETEGITPVALLCIIDCLLFLLVIVDKFLQPTEELYEELEEMKQQRLSLLDTGSWNGGIGPGSPIRNGGIGSPVIEPKLSGLERFKRAGKKTIEEIREQERERQPAMLAVVDHAFLRDSYRKIGSAYADASRFSGPAARSLRRHQVGSIRSRRLSRTNSRVHPVDLDRASTLPIHHSSSLGVPPPRRLQPLHEH